MKIVEDAPSALTALDRPNSYIGRSVPRPNLTRLAQGRGQYVSDVVLPRMAHAAFRRSTCGVFRSRPRFSGSAFLRSRPSQLLAGRFAPGRSSETARVRADERACRAAPCSVKRRHRSTPSPSKAERKVGKQAGIVKEYNPDTRPHPDERIQSVMAETSRNVQSSDRNHDEGGRHADHALRRAGARTEQSAASTCAEIF